eukprot:gene4597-5841_t
MFLDEAVSKLDPEGTRSTFFPEDMRWRSFVKALDEEMNPMAAILPIADEPFANNLHLTSTTLSSDGSSVEESILTLRISISGSGRNDLNGMYKREDEDKAFAEGGDSAGDEHADTAVRLCYANDLGAKIIRTPIRYDPYVHTQRPVDSPRSQPSPPEQTEVHSAPAASIVPTADTYPVYLWRIVAGDSPGSNPSSQPQGANSDHCLYTCCSVDPTVLPPRYGWRVTSRGTLPLPNLALVSMTDPKSPLPTEPSRGHTSDGAALTNPTSYRPLTTSSQLHTSIRPAAHDAER